ncbi:M23 family metallopeptidase [Sphingosinicella rhizophila]|uniref:M23 family metallopeptidase n=1 Tax=Sphingosinicella rhizophila TaxID=3050082 RepID=A0ABU3QC21_9SPHN|nr:M23 family metallopeptidase [Sphingosinicella sp. GR2756]MDT9600945.1 M23 family metallopeptidase [Sphingosinicella sp. GR2756]
MRRPVCRTAPLFLIFWAGAILPLSAQVRPTAIHVDARRASAFQFSGPMRQSGIVTGVAPSGTASLTLDGQDVPYAADRQFILGFDRDQAGEAQLVATLGDGSILRQVLRILPEAWQIEHVDIARRPKGPSADYLRVRQGELARIAAARAVRESSEGWRQTFIWPATGRISGVFGSQRIYRGEAASFHSGVDVAAGAGATVATPADGVVVLAGPPSFSLEGNLVIVDHGMGLNSAFLHLAEVNVREGQVLRQGQLIGTVGSTGRATGPHLHWSMKWKDARIDPQALAGPMRR